MNLLGVINIKAENDAPVFNKIMLQDMIILSEVDCKSTQEKRKRWRREKSLDGRSQRGGGQEREEQGGRWVLAECKCETSGLSDSKVAINCDETLQM